MLDATGERGSEGIRIGDPGSDVCTSMSFVIRPETVNAQGPLVRVELRGILSAGDAPSVRLFGYPAFVADVGVAAGGVHRRDDPPRFRRRAIGHGQPRAGGSMLFDVFGGSVNAHIRKAGALEVESAKLLAVHLEWALVPVAFDSLPQFSRGFAPFLRVVKHLASRRLNRLTRYIRSINNTRIRFQGVVRAHTVNYAII
jgi:hypothetical protein